LALPWCQSGAALMRHLARISTKLMKPIMTFFVSFRKKAPRVLNLNVIFRKQEQKSVNARASRGALRARLLPELDDVAALLRDRFEAKVGVFFLNTSIDSILRCAHSLFSLLIAS
jgi:hypothetical protein